VERPDRAVGVHGELRNGGLAHQGLEVRPDRVGALGEHPVALVEHLVEDLDALVGLADLVDVRIEQRPGTSVLSQSLTTELTSPPTYWTGLRTRGSSGSRAG